MEKPTTHDWEWFLHTNYQNGDDWGMVSLWHCLETHMIIIVIILYNHVLIPWFSYTMVDDFRGLFDSFPTLDLIPSTWPSPLW